LIINSPADVAKTVYAAAKCMDMMENHYFNGEPGLILVTKAKNQLKKYHFKHLNLQKLH
jgi:3',5'-cyclic-nucleotide phosphodiesterase